ncbi:acetoacetate--CoA ligase [Chelatococcus reniformis]|uniref:Acetoacetyl-CoA synthetase n=1 Tax=Chelatococcus reniformis TaxID=1494448 RepID=A0A916U2D3_9HYPH|nr:acetoacetate--CoA ligase [Chelatococcus reniformis]GGC57898.1 acetoacetyl-CoA synthetase [Chelatococcus reniformis]
MVGLSEGKLLWTPTAAYVERARITHYMAWLAEHRGLAFTDYQSLWEWSVDNLETFWATVWDHFDIKAERRYDSVLSSREMPGARWFEGARLNYVDQVLRHRGDDPSCRAIVYASEGVPTAEISWGELRAKVAAMAASLAELGVGPGDRVVAIMPNIPETIVSFLAVASLGAVWSLCSSDMGENAVLDRFTQIEPKVLIAADGYRYAGKPFARGAMVAGIARELPSLKAVVILPRLEPAVDHALFPGAHDWSELAARRAPLAILPVAADHPLWVVYSSGTTGLPKPIVHGHAGITLEMVAMQALHCDLGPDDTAQWYTSSGWIMWNAQVAALASGASIAIYDGNPGYPDLGVLWTFVEQARVTVFGAGAAYFAGCAKAGLKPNELADLSSLRALSSTGSPLSAEAYEWIYGNVRSDIWLSPISGGTDFAGAFICGTPILPVYAGEMQCRALGHKVEAFDESGHPVIDEVGELVCTEPVPSMPLQFWNDPGDRRYRESYFEVFPGVWRHGDWIKITPRGGAIIYGRSDATINRHGIRMGTSEFYRLVDEFPEVADSLVVDLEFLGRESFLYLFVVLRDGATLDDRLAGAINVRIRQALSARHVPNAIVAAPAVPYTLSGKKLEVPIKKLLLGHAASGIANRDAMANPTSLDWYIAFAAARTAAEEPAATG